MATIATTQYGNHNTQDDNKTSLLASIVDALFAVKLREELDAKTSGDKSDGAYTWGM